MHRLLFEILKIYSHKCTFLNALKYDHPLHHVIMFEKMLPVHVLHFNSIEISLHCVKTYMCTTVQKFGVCKIWLHSLFKGVFATA